MFKHEYNTFKCHLELREYRQDESVCHIRDNPSSRWAVDGRSYAINKSKGVSRMVSAFEDYTQRGKFTYIRLQIYLQIISNCFYILFLINRFGF